MEVLLDRPVNHVACDVDPAELTDVEDSSEGPLLERPCESEKGRN